MDLQSTGQALLKEHNELFFELIQIPERRKVSFHIDVENGIQLGKPRFDPPIYTWSSDLYIRLSNHLQNIWYFLDANSVWFDDTLKPIITTDDRRIDKRSVIFLLQHDIHEPDEIYGIFSLEKILGKYSISYFRHGKKYQTFEPKVNTHDEVERWIILDARKQIIDQFSFLWNYLQSEIESCINNDYIKISAELLNMEYIINKSRLIGDIIEISSELALLNLGNLAELYLILLLKLKSRPKDLNLSWEARNNGLITNQQMKLFESIRKEQNLLKHRLAYESNKDKVAHMWNNFFSLIISQ